MSDFGYLHNAAAIRREESRRLEPPDDMPEFCDGCGDEKPCTFCLRCAWCGETKTECTGDCENGHSAACDERRRYVNGVLTRVGCDCIAVWEEHEARWAARQAGAEALHIEEALDARREERPS